MLWYLLVSFGVVQILTTSKLFGPWRNRYRVAVETSMRAKGREEQDVQRYAGYWECPMCVGVPVGFILSQLMGVYAPLGVYGELFGDGIFGRFWFFAMGGLLASFAVSGTAYIFTMLGRVLESHE